MISRMIVVPLYLQYCFSVLFLLPITLADTRTTYKPTDHYLVNCGGPSESGGGGWKSDEDPTLTPWLTTAGTTNSTTTTTTGNIMDSMSPPYQSARIFWAPLTYSFRLSSPGPYLIRLYFSATTTLNRIEPSLFYVSVNANEFTLLRNFSAYSAAAHAKANARTNPPVPDDGRLVREFYVTIGKAHQPLLSLNLSPQPSLSNTDRIYGFINGIEVISAPDGLYVPNYTTTQLTNIPYLTGGGSDNENHPLFSFPESVAMETVIRLNVGGSDVQPSADDTGLNRTWYKDDNFLGKLLGAAPYNYPIKGINYMPSTPAYAAPVTVYGTFRTMGLYTSNVKLTNNLTWMVEVEAGFNYLVRLHFCQLLPRINQSDEYVFDIYINGEIAVDSFDFFSVMGGPRIAMYRDFVVFMNDNEGGEGATKKTNGSSYLSVALHPIKTMYTDAFLNGLEIFKLNKTDGSVASPNPNLPATPITPPSHQNNHPKHHPLVRKIIGGALGAILLFLVASAFYFMCRRKDKEEESSLILSTTKPTTPKWAPIAMDESHSSTATSTATISNSSVASSLPSDLCRRFSLNQVRIATSDFDDSVVIGSGGFGKVYKGSIDNGATLVAIKRLNPSSNQGANEFRNEIEMLSRLRHIHLVSLIGYCEDHGEMILVYEYMPRGTLRDHLLYKNDPRNNENSPLSWKQRLMICAGSARGLHYLHSGANHPIIHRDVKSTNILLDEKWTAKVSDFGLSKVGPTTGTGHVSTAVKGSVGYLDPEYYRLRQLTEKSDVYSFGVVLFEVLCGRQAMNPQLPKEQVNLALWARSHYIAGSLETIVDPNLAGQIAPESLRKFGEVAEMCVRDHGSERPSMSDIVWALEFALQLQQTADQKITGTPNGDDHGVTTKTDQVLISSEDNLSESSLSIGGSGTVKSFDTRKVASSSDSEAVGLTSSASVFSEIMHPQAR